MIYDTIIDSILDISSDRSLPLLTTFHLKWIMLEAIDGICQALL